LSNVTAIAAGSFHSLALKIDGTVVAWGDNSQGQSTVPPGLSGVTAIAAYENYSLALKSDSTIMGWGAITVPPGLSGIKAIAAGKQGLALKNDGTIISWNQDGTIFIPQIPGLWNVSNIAAGASNFALIPNIPLQLLVEDDFNRPNNLSLGNRWIKEFGELEISQNKLRNSFSHAPALISVSHLSEKDLSIQEEVAFFPNSPVAISGITARNSGVTGYMGFVIKIGRDTYAAISYYSGRQSKLLGSGPITALVPEGAAFELEFTLVGSELQLFVNDSLVVHVIDSRNTGPGTIGLLLDNATVDNFTGWRASATLPFFDSFNRPNQDSMGLPWIELIPGLHISNTQLVPPQNQEALSVVHGIDVLDIHQSAMVDVSQGDNRYAGFVARYLDENNFYLGTLMRIDSKYYAAIYRGTTLLNITQVPTGFAKLGFTVQGCQLKLYLNDMLVLFDSESDPLTSGKVGLFSFKGTFDDYFAQKAEVTLPIMDRFDLPPGASPNLTWNTLAGRFGFDSIYPWSFLESKPVHGLVGLDRGLQVLEIANLLTANISLEAYVYETGDFTGFFARRSAPGDYYYGGLVRIFGVRYAIILSSHHGQGRLLSIRQLIHNPNESLFSHLRFQLNGTLLTLFFNGQPVLEVDDSSLQKPGAAGIYFDNHGDLFAPTRTMYDNFLAK
jgi:hypothetical protein